MDPNTLEVNIDISIRSYHSGNMLQLRDTVQIQQADFLDLAKLLKEFHDVAEAVKVAREPKTKLLKEFHE